MPGKPTYEELEKRIRELEIIKDFSAYLLPVLCSSCYKKIFFNRTGRKGDAEIAKIFKTAAGKICIYSGDLRVTFKKQNPSAISDHLSRLDYQDHCCVYSSGSQRADDDFHQPGGIIRQPGLHRYQNMRVVRSPVALPWVQ